MICPDRPILCITSRDPHDVHGGAGRDLLSELPISLIGASKSGSVAGLVYRQAPRFAGKTNGRNHPWPANSPKNSPNRPTGSTISGGPFDVDVKRSKAKELEARMLASDFWSNPDAANAIIASLKPLTVAIKPFAELEAKLADLRALLELCEEDGGESLEPELEEGIASLAAALDKLEFQAKMSGPTDACDAFVTVHAGAGGTESCDWAQMLYRMYIRWAEEHGFDLEEIDLGPGEAAGIRGVTFAVRGPYAYGRLRSEIGVHRLVRISPFDAQARRHTSFASVDVMADLKEEIEVDIKEGDIEMETFMSGGPGGQHQNKTASGVRLRHLPTGLAVESRSERSQHQNRKMAMNLLKARLYRLEEEKRDAELARLYDAKGEIAFGSQIRSYVLHPYQLVKDHRTDIEVGNAGGVLDGAIDPFIEGFLKAKMGPAA